MPRERIQPTELVNLPTFTQVIRADKTIYVSGQTAWNVDRQVVGPGDITAQTTQVFENLKIALAAAGADFSHLVKVNVYATDAGYLPAIRAVRAKYLGTPDPVASTFVVVAGLAVPELLVEIEAIAVLD
jgi:enamine deaminase RidA (YjgF/YER057c/UK114 family)